MWQCPTCAEQHEDQFDTCWQCGTVSTGSPSPDFCISEPAIEQDRLPDSPADDSQLPLLRLPTITYFSIPPVLWLSLATLIADIQPLSRHLPIEATISPTQIVLLVMAELLVGIPIFFAMVRGFFHCIVRKKIGGNSLSNFLWLLTVFRLPELFHHKHCWFVPVYYVSIGAYVIIPFVAIVWKMVHFG